MAQSLKQIRFGGILVLRHDTSIAVLHGHNNRLTLNLSSFKGLAALRFNLKNQARTLSSVLTKLAHEDIELVLSVRHVQIAFLGRAYTQKLCARTLSSLGLPPIAVMPGAASLAVWKALRNR